MKHPGYMNPFRIRQVKVTSSIVLLTDPEFEKARVAFMSRILDPHGVVFIKADYSDRSYANLRCYDYAMLLCEKRPELIYCEGVMRFHGDGGHFDLPHGWTCTPDGVVVDPTCPTHQNNPDVEYIGIPFRMEYAKKWHRDWGFHGMLDGHPGLGYNLGVYADPERMWKQSLSVQLTPIGKL